MLGRHFDGQATDSSDLCRAYLGVSEVVASHGEMPSLILEPSGLLHKETSFDYAGEFLHEPRAAPLRGRPRPRGGAPRAAPPR
jgi:hypothetical protein